MADCALVITCIYKLCYVFDLEADGSDADSVWFGRSGEFVQDVLVWQRLLIIASAIVWRSWKFHTGRGLEVQGRIKVVVSTAEVVAELCRIEESRSRSEKGRSGQVIEMKEIVGEGKQLI